MVFDYVYIKRVGFLFAQQNGPKILCRNIVKELMNNLTFQFNEYMRILHLKPTTYYNSIEFCLTLLIIKIPPCALMLKVIM